MPPEIRRALLCDPECDERSAELLGVDVDVIRDARRDRDIRREWAAAERTLGAQAVQRRARELAELTGWTGSLAALVARVLDRAITNAGDGRSAGRTMSRSQARAEAPEGLSGIGNRERSCREARAGAAVVTGVGSSPLR
jgi:hypothetical protein